MDTKRKRELLEQWKNRRPEMGVISICCKATGDLFLGISKDTKADFNSNRFQLNSQNHPNRPLQALWNQYGADEFICAVECVLKYENPEDDYTEKLMELLEQCQIKYPQARRIRR